MKNKKDANSSETVLGDEKKVLKTNNKPWLAFRARSLFYEGSKHYPHSVQQSEACTGM
jgi:hypothetical protein